MCLSPKILHASQNKSHVNIHCLRLRLFLPVIISVANRISILWGIPFSPLCSSLCCTLRFAFYVVPTLPRDLNERTAAATTSLLAIKAAFSLFPITRNHLCARPNLWDVGTKYKAKWSVQRGEEQRGEEGGLPTCDVHNICYVTKLSFSGILGPLW